MGDVKRETDPQLSYSNFIIKIKTYISKIHIQ